MAVLVLALLAMGAPAITAGPEDGIRPEFLAGTLGGYAGAALGTYTLSWAFSLPVFPRRSAGARVVFGIGIALDNPETVLPFAPPIAAAGATAGFNVGARSRR